MGAGEAGSEIGASPGVARAEPLDPARGDLAGLLREAVAFHRDPLVFFRRLRDRYGETVIFPRQIGRLSRRRPLLVSSDPRVLRQVLTNPCFRNSTLALPGPAGSAQRRLRRSLFRMWGDEHRRHRRVVAPALAKRAVESYADTMVRVSDSVLDRWRPGELRDVAPDMKELARLVSSTALFGLRDVEASARIGALAESWWAESYHLPTRLLAADFPGSPHRRMLRKAERLQAAVGEMIARKRAEGLKEDDLLTRLIRAREEQAGITDGDLVGHANILFLAAHETTAYALDWTLFLLAQHPEVARDVCDELSPLGGRAPAAAELEALPLLERVIRESLRLLPVVPYGARIAQRPVEIAGFSLPRKGRVYMPFFLMHHDARYFPEPRRFRPERWLAGEPPPYTYLPFSAGPHMCIGMSFAMQTLVVAIARVMQRFRLSLAPGARIDRRVTVTLAPRRGLPMRIAAPDGRFERAPVRGDVLDFVELA